MGRGNSRPFSYSAAGIPAGQKVNPDLLFRLFLRSKTLMQDSTLGPKYIVFRACPADQNHPKIESIFGWFLPPFLFPESAMNAAGGTLLTLSPWSSLPLPAMTDDRHADALGVTRRERRREYQGTGGRDEEAPRRKVQRLPAAMRTANPAYAGKIRHEGYTTTLV